MSHNYDSFCFCIDCCSNEKHISNIAKNDKLLEEEKLRQRGLIKLPELALEIVGGR